MAPNQSSEEVQDELQCPVCFKVPKTTPVYQCKEGHIHCKDCHPKLKNCPVCRSNVLDIRALTAEKWISKTPLNCSYHDSGCESEKMALADCREHEKDCKYRPMTCFARKCKEIVPVCKAIEHMRAKHGDIQLSKSNSIKATLKFPKLVKDTTKVLKFKPKHCSTQDRDFLCLMGIDEAKFFSVAVILIGSMKEKQWFDCHASAKYKFDDIEYEVKSKGPMNVVGEQSVVPVMTLHPNQLIQMLDKDNKIEFVITVTSDSDHLEEDLEVSDETSTNFIKACNTGKLQEVKDYFELAPMPMPNARTKNKQTGFIVACIKGHTEIIEWFLQNAQRLKIDLNAQDKYGCTGAHYAVSEGHLEIVKLLCEASVEVDFNLRSIWEVTAFTSSCIAADIFISDIFDYLTSKSVQEKNKICYNICDGTGNTAFHYACNAKNYNTERLVKLIIDRSEELGIDLDKENNDGDTGYDLMPRTLRESLKAKRPRLD